MSDDVRDTVVVCHRCGERLSGFKAAVLDHKHNGPFKTEVQKS